MRWDTLASPGNLIGGPTDYLAELTSSWDSQRRAISAARLARRTRKSDRYSHAGIRNALGNRLILRLDDQKTSEIAMNERGAERLLGQGHMIAKLQGLNENIYVQVPFLSQADTEAFAAAISEGWHRRGHVAPMRTVAAE